MGLDSRPSGQSWILIIMIAFCACTIGLVTSMSVPLSIMTLKPRPRWNKTQWDEGTNLRVSWKPPKNYLFAFSGGNNSCA